MDVFTCGKLNEMNWKVKSFLFVMMVHNIILKTWDLEIPGVSSDDDGYDSGMDDNFSVNFSVEDLMMSCGLED